MKIKTLFMLHFIVVTLLFFNTGSYRNWPYKIESDGKYSYQYLLSFWYDGDMDFANNYILPRPPFMLTEIDHYNFKALISPLTGRPANWFTMGPAILWSPFFLAAYGLAYLLNQSGLINMAMEGWGQYFQYTVMYSAVIYSTVTLVLIFQLLKLYFDETISLTASFVLFWATNWIYYSLFEVSMSHVYDLFTLALFLWVYLKILAPQKTAAYLLAGLLAGLHILVRTQNVLTIATLVSYYVIRAIVQNRAESKTLFSILRGHLILIVVLLLSLSPLFLTNLYIYGHALTIPQGSNFFNLQQPALYGVLLSSRNGLFSHHPILLLGASGVLLTLINYRAEQACLRQIIWPLLLVFIVQLYLNSTVADWWAGHAFGQRRLISSFLLFAFGLAYGQKYWYRFAPGARIFVISVATFFILANLYLIYIHLFMWDYDKPHHVLRWMLHEAPMIIYLKYLH